MFGWAEMLILLISCTRVIKSEPSVDQVHVRAYPVSHELLQSSPSLRVSSALIAEGRNVHMTYARSSPDLKDCLLGRITTPCCPSICVCVCARFWSVSATCCRQELSQCVQALPFCMYQTPAIVTLCQPD